MNRSTPRPWWQFQLRDMLAIALVFAVLAGWYADRRDLLRQIDRLRDRGGLAPWSVEQVLGVPDTPGAGDISTAWASATPDGSREWLELEYATAVVPKLIEIHETYNPGAVDKVSVWDARGNEVVVWTGADPVAASAPRGVAKIPVTVPVSTKKIKIYLDSPKFPGWNEIDAVGLSDAQGRVQWAVRARASSSYGGFSGSRSPPSFPFSTSR